ncbi:MAG TPA: family 10 glycosylhydrolase [Myxococcota bacterium]|nr:family 10 glycosylhydrolase [Myxococcota bacterium]
MCGRSISENAGVCLLAVAAAFGICCSGSRPDIEKARPDRDGGSVDGSPVESAGSYDGGTRADVDSLRGSGGEAPYDIEARAVWVCRTSYNSPDDVRRIISTAAGAGFNVVYFQVRGVADAYYHSSVEPWAAALTGKLGVDPGWDPLQTAIDTAHRAGIELHAWINVCTAWKGRLPPGRSRPPHILRAHPEWRVAGPDGHSMPYSRGYVFMNPANPGFVKHIKAVVAELCSFYDLDGLHLDYARYPVAGTSRDRSSNRLYLRARRSNSSLTRAGWQRAMLTRLVASLRTEAHRIRPRLLVSAAVTGIYKDDWGWGRVTQGFSDFHQDSHAWAEQRAVDLLVPMIYWPPSSPPGMRADFLTLVEDFAPLSKDVGIIAGINVAAGDFTVLEEEIRIARSYAYTGVALFSYTLLDKRGWFSRLAKGPFKNKTFAREKTLAVVVRLP